MPPTAPSAGPLAPDALRFALQAMGTRFELVLPRAQPSGSRTSFAAGADAHLVAAAESALYEIEDADRRLSRFRPNSLVAHLNARCAQAPQRLDDDFFELLEECCSVHAASGGAFDVTLGRRMAALGFWDDFRGSTRDPAPNPIVHRVEEGAGGIPDDRRARRLRPAFEFSVRSAESGAGQDAVSAAESCAQSCDESGADLGAESATAGSPSRMGDIVLDRQRRTLAFRGSELALDFGAIGKGHALDRAAERLREAGVASAFLHGGTSAVLALGGPPGADAWRVAIAIPGAAAGGPQRVVCRLRDAALGVSAPHGRSARGDRQCTHVLDPRTGAPARSVLVAAVVTRSARSADAWSTALVAGASPAALVRAIGDASALVATRAAAATRLDLAGPAFEVVPSDLPLDRPR